MLKVRECYEEIFKDIEGDQSDVYVQWPVNNQMNALAYPKFVSKLKQKKELVKFDNTTNAENFIKKSIEFQKGGDNLSDIDLNTEQIKFLDLDNLKQMSKSDLINLRESISLEMLWIQQAIQSRIQVLFKFKAYFIVLFFIKCLYLF